MNDYKKANRIIKITEDLCDLPVRVVWDDSLQVGAIVHLSEFDWAKQIRISVKPGRKDTDYLVALQCAMAIKFCQDKNESKDLSSCEGSLEKTIEEFMQLGLPLETATQTANQIVPNLGQQLRGSAPQLKLSTWIHYEFPELRKSQLIHHSGEVNTSIASLKVDHAIFPKWLLESHQAMNGAFALASDYLFDGNEFFKPFKEAGFEKTCVSLLEFVTACHKDDPDHILVSQWINYLNLSDKFRWVTHA